MQSTMRCAAASNSSILQPASVPPILRKGRTWVTRRLLSAGQHQVALRHREEAGAQGIETEPRAALLANPGVQFLEAVDVTRGASLGCKHPRPAALGEALTLCEAALKDRPELPVGREYPVTAIDMTGCRRNDITTLRWFDVDVDAGKLHLARHSVHKAAARVAASTDLP